jgi:hypothetical protein
MTDRDYAKLLYRFLWEARCPTTAPLASDCGAAQEYLAEICPDVARHASIRQITRIGVATALANRQ